MKNNNKKYDVVVTTEVVEHMSMEEMKCFLLCCKSAVKVSTRSDVVQCIGGWLYDCYDYE